MASPLSASAALSASDAVASPLSASAALSASDAVASPLSASAAPSASDAVASPLSASDAVASPLLPKRTMGIKPRGAASASALTGDVYDVYSSR